jgi:hypothetical protein
VRVDLVAPNDRAVVEAEGKERPGARVRPGQRTVGRTGGDVREIRMKVDAGRGDDAAAVRATRNGGRAPVERAVA